LSTSTANQDERDGGAPKDERAGEADRPARRTRRSSAERQTQITKATLLLMARYGLAGTTVHRIAEEVGMEAPSLYSHFPGRQEILLSAIDALFERVAEWLNLSQDPNALSRLRAITESHGPFMTREFEGFVAPMFEFIAAPRGFGLTEVVARKQLEAIEVIAGIVEEGKRQGTIREDMDPRLAAWEIVTWAMAEDVAQLLGAEEYLTGGISAKIADVFLRDMAAPPNPSPVPEGGSPSKAKDLSPAPRDVPVCARPVGRRSARTDEAAG
jgi:AcrR family transcriptional regulator